METSLAESSGSGKSSGRNNKTKISSKEKNINEDNSVTKKESKGNNRKHAMGSPNSFLKEGAYVWCDPDGVWTIFWKNDNDEKISITIKPESKIKFYDSKYIDSSVDFDEDKVIINNISHNKKGSIQFETESDITEVNISLDNAVELKKVFIGHLMRNPKTMPLKLSYRNIQDIADEVLNVSNEEDEKIDYSRTVPGNGNNIE